MNRLESIFRLGVKELVSLSRDVSMVGLMIYAFTYAVYGPATGARMEVRNASVAIVDEDHSMLSARLGDALVPPLFLRPQYLDRAQFDAAMDDDRFTFVIDIPPRFQADLQAGRRPAVQLNVDATAMSQAGRGAGYIEEILTREIVTFAHTPVADPAARLVVRARFNANLSDAWFLGIAQIIDNITLLALILSGAAVVREREHGTLEHLLVLPLRPSDIMLAKIAANGFAIVIMALLSVKIVVEGLLQVPVAGSLSVFAVVTALYLFAISSLGILLATLARSMPQFGLLAFLVYLVLNMLSGGVTPLDSMPEWLQTALQLSPTTHFFNAAFAILYRGAGLGSVGYDVLAMVAMGSVFFVIALLMFRRTLNATALAGA